jgi:hypothetical protein
LEVPIALSEAYAYFVLDSISEVYGYCVIDSISKVYAYLLMDSMSHVYEYLHFDVNVDIHITDHNLVYTVQVLVAI